MKKLFYLLLPFLAFVGCTESGTDESTPHAFINLSATNYVVGHEGGEVVVKVESNVEFDVRISDDWIQLTSTNVTEQFTFNILANESGNDREGTISFVSNDKLITQTVSVKQNHDTTKPAYNEIWYTSTDGYAINPINTVETFGATIVSNTYDAKARKGVITFDGNVTKIGERAFARELVWGATSKLESITIPNSVTEIGTEAFMSCNNLINITISENVTTIGDFAFSDCSSLTSIIIPNNVTEIGRNTFSSCSSLTNITIPDSVTKIGERAFQYCRSLTSITIPDSVTTVFDMYTRTDCNSLECVNIIISNLADFCYSNAFSGLSENKRLFLNNSEIKNLTIPDNVTDIGEGVFCCCNDLTSVTIPNSVTEIGDRAFYGCNSVKSVTILDGVTSIGKEAFEGCDHLTTVTIGKNVKSIGYAAFNGKNSLLNVYCKATTPPATEYGISWSAFANNPEGRKIYVPTESVEKYKTAEAWSVYADDIIGYDFNE